MSGENDEKLKYLLEALPAGFLVDSVWLERSGIGHRSAYYYVKRGWLERVARGVFRRPTPNASRGKTIGWKTATLSLQHIMDRPIHVGGITALGLQGYSHYLPLGGHSPVWMYGNTIPNWLAKLPMDARLEPRRTTLFADPMLGLTEESEGAIQASRTSLPWDWTLIMSTPERAILEALDELPDHESFHNLDRIFESLTTLRPKPLSALLHDCKKIKVKRLFFVFADRHSHAWRRRLDAGEFNLGSGDRAFVTGGKMHTRYRIMVPEEFAVTRTGGIDGA